MRFILGLPNAAKLPEKESLNTVQGQEMEKDEVLMSRKENLECGDCVSSLASRRSEEDGNDDFNVRSLMLATDQTLAACLDVKPQELPEEKRSCYTGTPSTNEEHASLLRCSDEDMIGCVQETSKTPSEICTVDADATPVNASASSHPTAEHYSWPNTLDTCHPCRQCCEECPGTLPESSIHTSSAIASAPLLPSRLPSSTSPTSFSPPSPVPPKTNPTSSPPINHSAQMDPDTMCICNENKRNLQTLVVDSPACVSSQWNEAAEHLVIRSDGDAELYQCVRVPQECLCHNQNRYQGPKEMTALSITSFSSLGSDGPMCRICHEGPLSDEDLIAPCRCSGTLSYQHQTCLEQWLQTRGRDACELCDYQFTTEHKGRPFSEWIQQPERVRDRRNILTDCGCFALLTPLVCVSTWLCLNGAYHYLNYYQGRGWEGVGLISLASVLILIYLFWSLMSLRYHCTVWRTWRQEHQRVCIVMATIDPHDNISKVPTEKDHRPDHCSLPSSPPKGCGSCEPRPFTIHDHPPEASRV